ncbi:MAG TPA: hypothetical protein VLA76_01755, partial [Candidatus Angelobacter sp.]|nr:hypothetical protein [Candidatus Angelobacter sp.]
MELLIALIPALPLAGFLFAVLVGPRLDHVPGHGHHGGHEGPGDHDEPHGAEAAADHPKDAEDEATRAAHATAATHDDHGAVDESAFRSVPTEEQQRATSPHAGHADDLANAEGAAGVIPEAHNDG